jgi:DNA gyrase subunit A
MPPEDATIALTHQGEIYWKTPKNGQKTPDRALIYTETIQGREHLTIVTDSGKAYPVAISEIPPLESQPVPALTLLPKAVQQETERVVTVFFAPEGQKSLDLLLLSQFGRIKRIPVAELEPMGNRGLMLTKLKESDRLSYACWTSEGAELAIATTGGRVLRFAVTDEQIPVMGRNAQGNLALRLRYGEAIVGCVSLGAADHLLLVSQLGYGKRLAVSALRLTHLGELGTTALQFASKNDNLAGIVKAVDGQKAIVVTNLKRYLIVELNSVAVWGKDGIGDRIVELRSQESIIQVISYQR